MTTCFLTKETKTYAWKKTIQQMVLTELDIHLRRIKFDSCLPPYTKISSKWVRDLSLKPGMLKLPESIESLNFLSGTSAAQEPTPHIYRQATWKSRFCSTEDAIRGHTDSPQRGRADTIRGHRQPTARESRPHQRAHGQPIAWEGRSHQRAHGEQLYQLLFRWADAQNLQRFAETKHQGIETAS